MKEEDAVAQVLDEIASATSLADGDVRTAGGDQDLDPPEVIVSWQAPRLTGYNGSNNFGAYTTDGQGTKTGREYHIYFRFEADITVRTFDEVEAHTLLRDIQNAFMPYEYSAESFHADTAEWDVGSQSPRDNPIFEPDWYEIGFPLRFTLLRRTTETATAIADITKTDEDSYIDTTLEDGEVTLKTKD